jgi:ribosomal-protein-alanine N-acetyltransferase
MTDTPRYFPDLQTERLILRNITEEDTPFFYNQFSDPQVTEYLMDEPPVADMSEAKAIVDYYLDPEGKNHNRWIIMRKTDQRPIGTCGFHKWDQAHQRAEIGYDLAADCWGQGIMSEALRVAINSGFERMGLNRIDAIVYVGNLRSLALLQKMGFQQEGILREYYYLNDTFYDHMFLGLLCRDWKE